LNALFRSQAPHELVDLEIAGFRALLHLLDAECDALRRVDADAIEHTAAAKHAQIAALEALGREREKSMRETGFPPSTSGVALWLRAADPSRENAWRTLIDLARTARDANARNGRLIARQRQHYDAATQALLSAAGIPSVYGADGRAKTAASTRAIAAI
jgi:flagella synthesis protein FlgN